VALNQSLVLTEVDFDADWRSAGVVANHDPVSVLLAVDGDVIEIAAESELVGATAVIVEGRVFTIAADLDNPQEGEFTPIFADSADTGKLGIQPLKQIRLHTTQPIAGKPAAIVAQKKRPSIPTNLAAPNILDALKGLPITGKFNWSLSIEQHPSGSLQLAVDRPHVNQVRDRLKKGTELEVLGIGFSVSNIQEKLEVEGYYTVSVSLTGKWAKPQYNDPAFLHTPRRRNSQQLNNEPQIDSECGVAPNSIPPLRQRPRWVSIPELASRVGVMFQPTRGATNVGTTTSLRNLSGAWVVEVPPDTPRDAARAWSADVVQIARLHGSILDWSHAGKVTTQAIEAGRLWNYQVESLNTTYQGDTLHSPNHKGYAAEFKNAQLTGTFVAENLIINSDRRKGLPQAKWKPRTPKKVTLRSGDLTYASPPSTVKFIRTMSQNFDASGDTKTLHITTTIDGQPFEEIEYIYGFRFQAEDVFTFDLIVNAGVYYTEPKDFWGVVSYKKKVYRYDKRYGFPLGHVTKGWKYLRFKQESDELETLKLFDPNDPIDQLSRDLYVFEKVPIVERSLINNVAFRDYYADAEEQSAWVPYKHCNPDGTSETRYVIDPTWAPTCFAIGDLTYSSCFNVKPNPDLIPGEIYEYAINDIPPKPFVIAGDESITKKSIRLRPARPAGINIPPLTADQSAILFDRFTERNLQDSATNNYNNKAVIESFAENEGRPSPVSRKPSLLEKVDPSQDQANKTSTLNSTTHQSIRFTVCTPGYTWSDPVNGSVSNGQAHTLDFAFTAVKTDLRLQDMQQSVQHSFDVPFNGALRPLDRISLTAQGENHSVIVTSVSNNLTIEGRYGKIPIITWEPTQVQAGIDREIPVVLYKTLLPAPPQGRPQPQPPAEQDPKAPNNPYPWDITHQQLLGKISPRSRGNF
jgi:hypothetical protein